MSLWYTIMKCIMEYERRGHFVVLCNVVYYFTFVQHSILLPMITMESSLSSRFLILVQNIISVSHLAVFHKFTHPTINNIIARAVRFKYSIRASFPSTISFNSNATFQSIGALHATDWWPYRIMIARCIYH